jgi:glutathione S-transferase
MLTIHKFGAAWGLPDISPFVVKLETYMRMAGIPYETKQGDPRRAPKKKIPYVVDDDVVLGDSRFIIEHLETKRGISLDARLTPRERAIATAFQSMLEEHLYYVLLYERWQLDANWERLVPTVGQLLKGAGVPGPMRGLVSAMARKQTLKTLFAEGTGRHSPAEVGRIGERMIGALAEQIGDGPYFFGAEPSTIDATAYAFAIAFIEAPFEGPVRDAAVRRANLKAYVGVMKQRYWAS